MEDICFLEIKKAIFYPNKIVIKYKWGNIIIHALEIDHISYIRPSIVNYLFLESVRQFTIHLKNKLYGDKNYILCISGKDFDLIQNKLKVPYYVT